MIRRYMLDTNQMSDIVRGVSVAARNKLADLKSFEFACISSITEAELLYGLAKRPQASVLRRSLERVLGMTVVLPWRHEEAIVYAELRAKQENAGKPLEPMDMLIAAHAIATDCILVSRDKAFRHVTNLSGLTNWSTDIS